MIRKHLLAGLITVLTMPLATCEVVRGPYLQMATPDSIVIVWRTEGPSNPVVRYGAAPDALDKTAPTDTLTTRVSVDIDPQADRPRLYKEPPADAEERGRRRDPSTAANTYQFEARITGLEPNTKYFYAVYDGDSRLAGGDENYYFVTSPEHGSPADLRLWVVGDSGTGGRDQKRVYSAVREFVANTNRELDAYIHVGDMAYSDGTDREFQRGFFKPYYDTLRNTVCWPSLGNHEGHTSRGMLGFGPYFDAYVVPTAGEAGGEPSGTEAYYSFDIADVHFVCLDSHDLDRAPAGAMAQWLRADLDQAQANWFIAFWHHPPYTKGSHDSDREGQLIEMRENFMPILEAGGVDLVLTGHSHIYERSMLIDGAYATPTVAEGVILDDGDGRPDGDGAYKKGAGLNPHEGTIAIVAGHGGANVGRSGTMPIMREIIVEHGSVILDIKGDTLTGTMIDKHGALRDTFALQKSGEVKVSRIENPWQPSDNPADLTELLFDFAKDAPGTLPKNFYIATGHPQGAHVIEDDGNKLFIEAKGEPTIALCDAIPQLAEFELETYVQIKEGPNTAGLVYGYRDATTYSRLELDSAAGVVRAVRIRDNEATILSEKKFDVTPGKWIKIELQATPNGKLEVQLLDSIDYRYSEGDVLDGAIGMYAGPSSKATFARLQIER